MSTNDNYDPEKDKAIHEEAEGLAAAAGTGLGCLGIALLPWSLILVVIVVVGVIVYIVRHTH